MDGIHEQLQIRWEGLCCGKMLNNDLRDWLTWRSVKIGKFSTFIHINIWQFVKKTCHNFTTVGGICAKQNSVIKKNTADGRSVTWHEIRQARELHEQLVCKRLKARYNKHYNMCRQVVYYCFVTVIVYRFFLSENIPLTTSPLPLINTVQSCACVCMSRRWRESGSHLRAVALLGHQWITTSLDIWFRDSLTLHDQPQWVRNDALYSQYRHTEYWVLIHIASLVSTTVCISQ